MASSSTKARKRKRHPNWHVFTRDDCRKGYQAALQKMVALGWEEYAWFFRHIRGWYRAKRKRG